MLASTANTDIKRDCNDMERVVSNQVLKNALHSASPQVKRNLHTSTTMQSTQNKTKTTRVKVMSLKRTRACNLAHNGVIWGVIHSTNLHAFCNKRDLQKIDKRAAVQAEERSHCRECTEPETARCKDAVHRNSICQARMRLSSKDQSNTHTCTHTHTKNSRDGNHQIRCKHRRGSLHVIKRCWSEQ